VVAGLTEIHQGEVKLLAVGMHPRAAADNLLELRHRAHFPVQHDQAAGLGIHAGGEQPRGGDEHRIRIHRIDEIIEGFHALLIVAGDAHHIAAVGSHQILVLIDQSLAHHQGVLGVDAKHDRFLHPVATGLEVVADPLRHPQGALIDHQVAIEILLVVEAIFDLHAAIIYLPRLGAIAHHINIEMHADHLVGRQKAIADALLEGIGVERLAEIFDI